ncbi:hypothetical protein IWQ62_002387 [Dispira parvispora]|uniref:Grh/CP2 DB domain-containing protein n=1 Tax=Dispira parvispora TaxID=1520584 RepID=A0A9W8ARF0_9FUNG|nr:hypothetical protein IWQ62_002387 [Dispira parvispora]
MSVLTNDILMNATSESSPVDCTNQYVPPLFFPGLASLNVPSSPKQVQGQPPQAYVNRDQLYELRLGIGSLGEDIVITTISIGFHDNPTPLEVQRRWALWRSKNASERVTSALKIIPEQSPNVYVLDVSQPDRITVAWIPGQNPSLALKFGFLSTDFTHRTGVKGVSARLIISHTALNFPGLNLGATYLPVKSFRGNGAQRRYRNDMRSLGTFTSLRGVTVLETPLPEDEVQVPYL